MVSKYTGCRFSVLEMPEGLSCVGSFFEPIIVMCEWVVIVENSINYLRVSAMYNLLLVLVNPNGSAYIPAGIGLSKRGLLEAYGADMAVRQERIR